MLSSAISKIILIAAARGLDWIGDIMEKHKFPPNNIYSTDETGITTVTDLGKVLQKRTKIRYKL